MNESINRSFAIEKVIALNKNVLTIYNGKHIGPDARLDRLKLPLMRRKLFKS